MFIKTVIQSDGSKLYDIYVCVRKPFGGKLQMRKRNISSMREAKFQESELKRKLSNKKELRLYTWNDWHRVCLERMKLEMRPSTIENYDGRLRKWTGNPWGNRDIKSIT